mgnify:CR=1 FL=1
MKVSQLEHEEFIQDCKDMCHIVPIGSINLVPKEDMGEDYIVLNEYQYIDKPEGLLFL